MGTRAVRCVWALTVATGVLFGYRVADSHSNESSPTQPVDTSVCEIAASPDRFDSKLLRLHAYISQGFEDFTLHDPACPEEAIVNTRVSKTPEPSIWIDFADEAGSWKVKGYAPLLKDDELAKLQSLLAERNPNQQMTGATLDGTFYSAELRKINGRITPLRGYGHLGCCSLFVISRVESVDTDYAEELDYSVWRWYVGLPSGCESEQMLGLPTNEMLRAWQQAANRGKDQWRYDAQLTAEDELRKLKSGGFGSAPGDTNTTLFPGKSDLAAPADSRLTERLLETASSAFIKRFEWIEPDHTTRFVIVVTRPYWLLKDAGRPNKVIWTPAGASVLNCPASSRTKEKRRRGSPRS